MNAGGLLKFKTVAKAARVVTSVLYVHVPDAIVSRQMFRWSELVNVNQGETGETYEHAKVFTL